MLFQTSLLDLPNVIFSPESESGHMRSGKPDGLTTDQSGQDLALVSLSARQAKALGLLTSGTYGQRSFISLHSANLALCLVSRLKAKTDCLGSTLYNLTWSQRVTPLRRLVPALRALARRTSDNAFTGWPTPRAHESSESLETQQRRSQKLGRKVTPNLSSLSQLASWPTPLARDYKDGASTPSIKQKDYNHETLGRAVWKVKDCPARLTIFWYDADWLFCRDGKWRAVEPGTSPLVDGASARMGRLRGYGNAIVAPQAQAFIEAYMEIKK